MRTSMLSDHECVPRPPPDGPARAAKRCSATRQQRTAQPAPRLIYYIDIRVIGKRGG